MVLQGFLSKDGASLLNHEHSKNPLLDEMVPRMAGECAVCNSSWNVLENGSALHQKGYC